MALELITPPDDAVVTLEEAKAFLNVTHSDHDELIEGLVDAATAALDGRYGLLQRALSPQTWELVLDRFPLVLAGADRNPAAAADFNRLRHLSRQRWRRADR
jgi:uncharacterized phiE125 gp8 family phage protein